MNADDLARKFGGVAVDADAVASRFGGVVEGPTERDRYLSHPAVRFAKGLKDPIDAAAQYLPRGLAWMASFGGAAPNRVSEFLQDEGRRVDQDIAEGEKEYQRARTVTAEPTLATLVTGKRDPGADWMRLGGNVLSPASVATMAAIPGGAFATLPRMAATGAAAGAVGGQLQPVTDEAAQADFASEKLKQGVIGAAFGGVATPAIGKLTQALGASVAKYFSGKAPKNVSDDAIETAINRAMADTGLQRGDFPEEFVNAFRTEVTSAIRAGKRLDPAALARRVDFDAAGIQPTLGQITRDPNQFAKERNLRGAANIGEPLMARFTQQNERLSRGIDSFGGPKALETVPAGRRISEALADLDEAARGRVTNAYAEVRAATGKDAEIPMQGLAQDVGRFMRDFDSTDIPAAVRTRLGEFGILEGQSGKQTKLFTQEDGEKLLQLINKHDDPARKATHSLLGELRGAVKRALTLDDGSAGAFAVPRALARVRFEMHDAIPGLRAAANGEAPDAFVQRYIVGGKTGEVLSLGAALRKNNPPAFEEARNQIGAVLQRSAFGENTSGDKLFQAEGFAKTLRSLGTDKLMAFYSPVEVDAMKRLARVGAYINVHPAGSAVNTSNNAGWLLTAMQRLPIGSQALSLGSAAARTIGNERSVRQALAADLKPEAITLTPQQEAFLTRLLGAETVGVGSLSPPRR